MLKFRNPRRTTITAAKIARMMNVDVHDLLRAMEQVGITAVVHNNTESGSDTSYAYSINPSFGEMVPHKDAAGDVHMIAEVYLDKVDEIMYGLLENVKG